MKRQRYQHHSERSFDVGDWVFLWLQAYKQMSLNKAKKDNTLSPKYYGPYKVLQILVLWHTNWSFLLLHECTIFPCFMLKEGYRWHTSGSNNIARIWWGRKNHIGTWSHHGNKNSIATKSINFRLSHQMEDITHWRFHMGGWEFYTEASITTQVLRTTLFWRIEAF